MVRILIWFFFLITSLIDISYAGDTAFFENFEGIVSLDEDSSTHFLWEIGTPTSGPGTAYSGNYCLATVVDGNYGVDYVSDFVIFGPIYIPSDWPRATLTFYHYYDFEQGYDGGNIMISNDGGMNYTILGIDFYNSQSVAGLNGGDSPTTYSQPGFTGKSSNWEKVAFDLNYYRGDTVYLKFHFGTDNSVNAYAGWYIDDITIDTSNLYGPVVYVTHDIIDTGPAGQDYTFTAQDTIYMMIGLQNKGNYAMDTVYCKIIPLDTYVVTISDTLIFNNLIKNQIKYSDYDLIFYITDDVPHNEILDFRVEIRDDSGDLWVYFFTEVAENPGRIGPLSIVSFDVYDFNLLDLYGNENGLLNPNEKVALPVVLHNYGQQDAGFVYSELSTVDTHIIIVDTTAYFGTVPADTEVESIEDFVIQTTSDAGEIDSVIFNVIHYSGDLVWTDSFVINIYPDTVVPAALVGQVYKSDGISPETDAMIYVYNLGYETAGPILKVDISNTGAYEIDTLPTGDFTLYVVKKDTPVDYFIGCKSVYGIISGHRTIVEDIIEWELKNSAEITVYEAGNSDLSVFPYDIYITTMDDTFLVQYVNVDTHTIYLKYIGADSVHLIILPKMHDSIDTYLYFDTSTKQFNFFFERYVQIKDFTITDTRVCAGFLLPWTGTFTIQNTNNKDIFLSSFELSFKVGDTDFEPTYKIEPAVDFISANTEQAYTITFYTSPPDSGYLNVSLDVIAQGITEEYSSDRSRDTFEASPYYVIPKDYYTTTVEVTEITPQFYLLPPDYPLAWDVFFTIKNLSNQPIYLDTFSLLLSSNTLDVDSITIVYDIDTTYIEIGQSKRIKGIVKHTGSDTGFVTFSAAGSFSGAYNGETATYVSADSLSETVAIFGESKLTLVSNALNKDRLYLQDGGVLWYTVQFLNPENKSDSIMFSEGNSIYLKYADGRRVEEDKYRVIKPFSDTDIVYVNPQSFFYMVFYIIIPGGTYLKDFTVYSEIGQFKTEQDVIEDPRVSVLFKPTQSYISSFFDSYVVLYIPPFSDTVADYKFQIEKVDYEGIYLRADRYLSGQRISLFRDGLIKLQVYKNGVAVNCDTDAIIEFHYDRLANSELCDEEYLNLLEYDYNRGIWQQVSGAVVYPIEDVVIYKSPKLGTFRLCDLSPENSFEQIKVYPIPFKTFEDKYLTIDYVPDNRDMKIEIIDVAGDVVRILDYSDYSGGKVLWDGRDMWGNRVGTGFYFLRILIEGHEKLFYILVIN